MESFLKEECNLKYFHDNGFNRKKCKSCGDYFWTLNPDLDFCGDQPCVKFSFIGKTITKKSLSLSDVRKSFLSYFEKNGHSQLSYPETGQRCPVVARWRSDIYLTIASIADFQPHITSGKVPPPANPLVISQPCIRLNDLDEVGRSGRHLTIFEMMGHHSFNKNIDEIYFKEDTVRYCNNYFVDHIGIPRLEINYKEQLWDGGGNAGPCLEVIAGGLEIATLVFMNMKKDEKGKFIINGNKYSENDLKIVDTGYGLERIAWYTQGTKTIYETALIEIIEWLKKQINEKYDLSMIYSLADHSKCLAFMLGDGVIPSNVKAGYLARLIIRRSLRFIKKLKLKASLQEIVDIELNILKPDFPTLIERKDQIDEILGIETRKFVETLTKGEGLINRILNEKKNIDENELITLYDTHGMPTDVVQNIAKNHGVSIKIPDNFESMIADLHSHEKNKELFENNNSDLPYTKKLYYDDHYKKEFNAEVIWKDYKNNITKIILDQTTFYPEGGGQPGDRGILSTNTKTVNVISTEKIDNTIIHNIDGDIDIGETVHGKIDWDQRYLLMKHHTGTHVVNGALRKIYGEHIWQAGSQLSTNEARFDFSHYKSIGDSEIKEIEKISNYLISQGVPVQKKIMKRNDAEKEFGFRLYQGGVPSGNIIRVINIPNVDVEACGGTHLNNIKEIKKIRILKVERIQDGVGRITFAAGKMVDIYQEKENKLYFKIVEILSDIYTIENHSNIPNQIKEFSSIFSVQSNQIEKIIKRFKKESHISQKTTVKTLVDAGNKLFNNWKKTKKSKKTISSEFIENIINKAEIIPDTDIKIILEIIDSDSIYVASQIIKKDNIVVHLYDGNKITSAASENVDIDLRVIAPEIGKIFGGSGGGKTKMTQSGGPKKDQINEALKLAKELTIKILIKKNN